MMKIKKAKTKRKKYTFKLIKMAAKKGAIIHSNMTRINLNAPSLAIERLYMCLPIYLHRRSKILSDLILEVCKNENTYRVSEKEMQHFLSLNNDKVKSFSGTYNDQVVLIIKMYAKMNFRDFSNQILYSLVLLSIYIEKHKINNLEKHFNL